MGEIQRIQRKQECSRAWKIINEKNVLSCCCCFLNICKIMNDQNNIDEEESPVPVLQHEKKRDNYMVKGLK